MGGYSSLQLDDNVFQVSFKGNAYISQENVNEFTLLRCAEIAKENKYPYFVIMTTKEYSKISSYTEPVVATTNRNNNFYGSANRYGNQVNYFGYSNENSTTTITGGNTIYYNKPRNTSIIICYKDKPNGISYNSDLLIKMLKSKYSIKN